jgi:hypothetical protein
MLEFSYKVPLTQGRQYSPWLKIYSPAEHTPTIESVPVAIALLEKKLF